MLSVDDCATIVLRTRKDMIVADPGVAACVFRLADGGDVESALAQLERDRPASTSRRAAASRGSCDRERVSQPLGCQFVHLDARISRDGLLPTILPTWRC
jgi:hypothetical protein